MQYQHGFHAGNFADVHKHVTLLALIAALQRKAKGFLYIDTHAGGGLYDLRGEQSRRGAEAAAGVLRLRHCLATTPAVRAYCDALTRLEQTIGADHYPGSPLLAASALREVDRGVFIESVAQESRHLQRSLDAVASQVRSRIRVECDNGYQKLVALLPPIERRALVLIDPPYESDDEYAQLLESIPRALLRLEACVIAVWLPIKRQRELDLWYAKLLRVTTQPVLACELWLHPRDSAVALNGSAMAIINPPWQLDEQLTPSLEELRVLLGGTGDSGSTVRWLRHE